jgi:hypothetical protein
VTPSREVTPSPLTPPQQEFRWSDFQKRVVEEQADRLTLLIMIGACGTLIASHLSVLPHLPEWKFNHPVSCCENITGPEKLPF